MDNRNDLPTEQISQHRSGAAHIDEIGSVETRRLNDAPADSTQTELLGTITQKEERKLAARKKGRKSAWFGLGMFGVIGWSVAVPTMAFVALGLWIDGRWPSRFSWTLMLLFLGMVLGCINAWHWITREREQIK